MAKATNAIPEGFHTLTPYLMVSDGNAAVAFYQRAFGATIGNLDADPSGKFLNAELKIGTSQVMIGEHELPRTSDGLPPVSIYVYVEDVDTLYANALAAGASVVRPLADQFYGNREGGVRDPFGITWWLAAHLEDLTPEEMQQRAAAHFKQAQ